MKPPKYNLSAGQSFLCLFVLVACVGFLLGLTIKLASVMFNLGGQVLACSPWSIF